MTEQKINLTLCVLCYFMHPYEQQDLILTEKTIFLQRGAYFA